MLGTKSIYAGESPGDGHRILVTRWWPRGVRREAIDDWVRVLAPSAKLLRGFKDGDIPWGAFSEMYRSEIDTGPGRRAILDLRERASSGDITLLCYERDGEHCHRHILREIILGESGEPDCADRRVPVKWFTNVK